MKQKIKGPQCAVHGAKGPIRSAEPTQSSIRSRQSQMADRAFTLIELLVVIAIIAVLAAIIFPVFSRAKEAAQRSACLSNSRQIGLAVMMYVDDHDGVFPIHYDYNSVPPAGHPGHKGVEVLLAPYVPGGQPQVNQDGEAYVPLMPIFKCPLDMGGPYTSQDVPGAESYWQAYGSSYHFTKCTFSIVEGESSRNNVVRNYTQIVRESAFRYPAETRLIRDEMFPIFDRDNTPDACERYGYDCDPPWNFYRRWHWTGGTMIFADGHAKHIVGGLFDEVLVNPEGNRSGDPHPTRPSWYWACD